MAQQPDQSCRPSMTSILASGVSRRRLSQQENGGRISRLDRMMASLEWRHSHLTSEEYPMEIAGIDIKFKQLMQGELTGLGTGATVWPAAHVLSKYLERRWPLRNGGMKNMRVIDLGSGTGAVGLVARVLGADVILTDQEQLSFLMHDNASRTLQAMTRNHENYTSTSSSSNVNPDNSIHPGVTIATYDWGFSDDHLNPPFDVIVVSDCVLPKLYPIEPLVDALVQLSKPRNGKSANPIILLSYEHRIHEHFDPRIKFEELATNSGFVKYSIPHSEQDPMYQADDIELWELRLKSQIVGEDETNHHQSSSNSDVVILADQKDSELSSDDKGTRVCRIRAGQCVYNLKRISNGGIGGDIWASSIAMCQYLLSTYGINERLRNLKVLELGSGIGLVALVCQQLGAHVVATDIADVVSLLSENILAHPNSPEIQVTAFKWDESPLPQCISDQSFDIVICADCVYAHASIEPLLQALEMVTKPSTQILISNEQRSALEGFISRASNIFKISHIGISEVVGVHDTRPVVMYQANIRS